MDEDFLSKEDEFLFEVQSHCGYEAAEMLFIACDGDVARAHKILNRVSSNAAPHKKLQYFYMNTCDGLPK